MQLKRNQEKKITGEHNPDKVEWGKALKEEGLQVVEKKSRSYVHKGKAFYTEHFKGDIHGEERWEN